MKKLTYLLLILTLLSTCDKDDDSFNNRETLWVNSEYTTCINFLGEEYPCISVQSNATINENEWSSFGQGIEDFTGDYEEGYIYRIKIGREKILNPAIDQSSFRVFLIEVISKEPI